VIDVASHGAVTLQDDTNNIFKVNGQCLKVFLEPKNSEEIDVIEFLQFNDPI
jgi:flagellar motor component MotA